MAERIGFVGLGIMGKPMSQNLLKAGHPVIAYDIVTSAVKEVVGAGATEGRSPKHVAESCDVVITMLPDSPQVDEVVFGADGVLAGIKAGQVFVDMSTISPITSRKVFDAMKAKGVPALDAPVSGGQKGAIDAALSIMVGGPQAAFDRVLPLFKIMGKNITLIGEDPGSGQVTKAANQIIVAVNIMAVAEALTMAKKAGVDPAKVRQALMGGFAHSRILEMHGQRILDHAFQPGFRIKLHQKDLGIALATGKAYGVPLYATALLHEILNTLVAQGHGDLDHSAIARFVESSAGLE